MTNVRAFIEARDRLAALHTSVGLSDELQSIAVCVLDAVFALMESAAPALSAGEGLRNELGAGVVMALQSGHPDLIEWAQRISIEYQNGVPVALAAPVPQEGRPLDTQAVYGPAAERRYLNPAPPARETTTHARLVGDEKCAACEEVFYHPDLDGSFAQSIREAYVEGFHICGKRATPASAPEGDKP